MSDRELIASLIPHQGRMCLLERIVEWDDSRVVAATRSHRDPGNPLRSAGTLSAIHLCEYGAQAMALHGGLVARSSGLRAAPALLVSLHEVVLRVERADDLPQEVVVSAQRLQVSPNGMQYRFEVCHDGAAIAEGRVAAIAVSGPRSA
ncbi:MAG: hypothetical protein U1F08_10970 [Steroidobacteraceae bacterium]